MVLQKRQQTVTTELQKDLRRFASRRIIPLVSSSCAEKKTFSKHMLASWSHTWGH